MLRFRLQFAVTLALTLAASTLPMGCAPETGDPSLPQPGELRLVRAVPVGGDATPLNANSDFSDYYAGAALPAAFQHAIPEKMGSIRRASPLAEDLAVASTGNRYVVVQEWLADDNALKPDQRFHTVVSGLKPGVTYDLEATASHPAESLFALNLHLKIGDEFRPVAVPAVIFRSLKPGPETVRASFTLPEPGDLYISSDVVPGSAFPAVAQWYSWKVSQAGAGLQLADATPKGSPHSKRLLDFAGENGGVGNWVKQSAAFRTEWEALVATQKDQPGETFTTQSGVTLRNADLGELLRSNFLYAPMEGEVRPLYPPFMALRRLDAVARGKNCTLIVVLVPSRTSYLAGVALPVTELLSVAPQRVLFALALADAGLRIYDAEAALRDAEGGGNPPFTPESLPPTGAALDTLATLVAEALATDAPGSGPVLLAGRYATQRDAQSGDLASRLTAAKVGEVRVLHGDQPDHAIPGLVTQNSGELEGARALVFLAESTALATNVDGAWQAPTTSPNTATP